MLGPYWKYPRLVMRRCRSYMCFTCACRSRRQVQWGINSQELLLRRSWVLSIISAIYQTSSSMEGKMIFASNFSNMIEFYVKYCLRCLWPLSSHINMYDVQLWMKLIFVVARLQTKLYLNAQFWVAPLSLYILP